jgi:hypothetical protein
MRARAVVLASGTPVHDHPGDILASLEAEHFRRCFSDFRFATCLFARLRS